MRRAMLSTLIVTLLSLVGSGCGEKEPKIIIPTGPIPPAPSESVIGGGAPAKKKAAKDEGELLGQPAPEPTRPPE